MLKKQAHKFFQWYCHPDYYEDIQGDLEELYLEALEESSVRKAEWFYTKEVLLLFRPTIIRPISFWGLQYTCLLYTSPSPRDLSTSRMPSSA